MPNSLAIGSGVELGLILVTSLLLAQPKWLFRSGAGKLAKKARWGGVFFLGLTFFWSVILGVILSMNNITIKI